MLDKILNRVSVRNYSNKELDNETLQQLKNVINSTPTSLNAHGFSAIFITDKSIMKEIQKEANHIQQFVVDAPLFIVFVADLNRIEYAFKKHNNEYNDAHFETIVNSIGDVFISTGILTSYCLSIGLSNCYIGFIRSISEILRKKLNLSETCIPIVGMTIGYPIGELNDVKPKLNKCYENIYDINLVNKELDEYDMTMDKYYSSRNQNKSEVSNKWSSSLNSVFSSKAVMEELTKQYIKYIDFKKNK